MKRVLPLLLIPVIVALTLSAAQADPYLDALQPNQEIHGFRTASLYNDGAGKAMGARFIDQKHGFIVDLMRIQSVPQAFVWIKTPITSSKGEPHACEHLLLGKGNLGRKVAALKDMALTSSTAYTSQYRTCYHLNTTAGSETFYEILEAELNALVNPDFTDEEIRREVCHIGVTVDQDSSLALEEKGTVYTEMVSSFERPWYYTYGGLNKLIYGDNHPLTWISGGDPDVMRSMVAEDMWKFHRATYHLANMGMILSIPDDMPVEDCLARLSELLDRVQSDPDHSDLVGIGAFAFPPINPAPEGTTAMTTYPSDRKEDPGYFMYSWPAILDLNYNERDLLNLFFQTFADGETSELYNMFINSETRVLDLGANSVGGWVDNDMHQAIGFSLTGLNNAMVTEPLLDSVRTLVVDALQKLHDLPDKSQELTDFNRRVLNRMIEQQKQVENYLNQPPMFGFRRGPAGAWLSTLEDLEDEPGFRKSLVFADRFAYLDSVLSAGSNIWRDRIDQWKLLTIKPYAVGASPDPEIMVAKAQAKQARLADYVEEMKQKYGVETSQLAVARYKEDFDANTAELEALASKQELPGFIEHPPMTLDDQLKYETVSLPGDVPLVASTFDNMTSARVGLALRLDVIPEDMLLYVPFLPDALTSIGVIEDGQVVDYAAMRERLRQEVLNFGASFDIGYERERVELLLTGDASNRDELSHLVHWMDKSLYHPYLTEANLPRMIDVLDQNITSLRNRVMGSEESWVQIPARAYRYQQNPLILSASCFFTQTHQLQRLRWQLTDPGDEAAQKEITTFLTALKSAGEAKDRDGLIALLTAVESGEQSAPALGAKIAASLRLTLPDIPDANLAHDWNYLCDETLADLMMPPSTALANIEQVLTLIRRSDNARMYVVSSTESRAVAMPQLEKLVAGLDSQSKSERIVYDQTLRIDQRLADREPGVVDPTYVGLVHEGTANGVLIFNARVADEYDTIDEHVMTCLAGKLFGGSGAHGLFMNTWAAGLAYSNGYGFSQATGRCSYYAERCPDVAETMKFVVNHLRTTEIDSTLIDYAVAQVFGDSRAPDRYESRGAAMAEDLTDGFGPDKVRAFREKVLDIKKRPGLFAELKKRMDAAYGPVMIGYGQPLAQSDEGSFFLIGPEPQFQTLENYIASVEQPQTVHRLYRRDFWLTMN